MKPAKSTKKKPAAVKPKTKTLKINMPYIDQIFDESIATMMAMRALIHELVAEKEGRR